MSTPIAGNHHDLYNIEDSVDELFETLQKANISTDSLFINADTCFDAKDFREICFRHGVIANVAFNSRNEIKEEEYLLYEELYEQRYAIERTNAWMDSYRTLLNRFETTISSWIAFNYIAFIVIFFKKIKQNEKSR